VDQRDLDLLLDAASRRSLESRLPEPAGAVSQRIAAGPTRPLALVLGLILIVILPL
jgi:hypothetical protein